MAPESDKQPPLKEGGAPLPPVAPVHPGTPNNLMEVLQGAFVMDEHHVLMGTVIETERSLQQPVDRFRGK